MSSMRLLKVIVQPVFVIDDGDNLTEQQGEQFAVTPARLEAFPADLLAQVAAYNEQLRNTKPPAT